MDEMIVIVFDGEQTRSRRLGRAWQLDFVDR
jgi:hypothetical protein